MGSRPSMVGIKKNSIDKGSLEHLLCLLRSFPWLCSFPKPGRTNFRSLAPLGPSQNPIQPIGPQTPEVCDSKLTFDAITTIRGEMMFFKDR